MRASFFSYFSFPFLSFVFGDCPKYILLWIWGGYAVTHVTLKRCFSKHCILPFVPAGFVFVQCFVLVLVFVFVFVLVFVRFCCRSWVRGGFR